MRTVVHLSKYGIFEPSDSGNILGTITIRRWADQSFKERLKFLEFADLITGTRLPHSGRTRRKSTRLSLVDRVCPERNRSSRCSKLLVKSVRT